MKDKKQCTKCNEKKGHDCFDKNHRSKDGLSPKCKECRKAYWKEYIARPEALKNHRDRNCKRRRLIRQEISEFVKELKDEPCTDCGNSFPYYVMHFDHLDEDEKVADVSRLRAVGASKEKILKEVAKCELVCANCHAERTHQRGYKNQI